MLYRGQLGLERVSRGEIMRKRLDPLPQRVVGAEWALGRDATLLLAVLWIEDNHSRRTGTGAKFRLQLKCMGPHGDALVSFV